MSPVRRSIARLATSLALVVVAAAGARAASSFDPARRYRTLRTTHFAIHFHQGEEVMAQRLARIAEDVWRALRTPLGVQPPSHTEVVLVDQTEFSNGYATPLPYNTIVVAAVWPSGAEFIGKSDDWLRIAFSHEFTHIVHLDRSEGWARIARRAFGRTPIAFPNLYLPQWQIEGLATYEESRLTGEGRLHAGDFGSVVEEAARRNRVEPLDRLNGGLTDWPNGDGAYAYGADFHRYLAEKYGRESLARLADATARWFPLTGSLAFEDVYGRSLGALWREYRDDLVRRTESSGAAVQVEDASRRLTHHGFAVAGPRFDPAVCGGCPKRVIYSARTLDGFPGLYDVAAAGGSPRRLADRYLGSTTAPSTTTLYFDQSELRRNTGLYSDLHALDRATGHVTRLTSETRLLDPDLSPDGATIVAVRSAPDRRELVLIDLARLHRGASRATPAASLPRAVRTVPDAAPGSSSAVGVLVSEPGTQFNAPRWSPDGRTIAAERHVLGRQSEIVLVDRETGRVRMLAGDPGTRFVTPAWRPDGRAIVAAADFDEGPFNLYEIDVEPPSAPLRQLTRTTGGATWPDISPDGTLVTFVGYTVDGFDVFVMPYPDSTDLKTRPTTEPGASGPTTPSGGTAVDDAAASLAPGRYNPAKTLSPTAWSPIIDGNDQTLRLGWSTGGIDVLGYHAYGVSASWLARSPVDAATRGSATPDWSMSYVYDRWRPTFWLSASADTSFLPVVAEDERLPFLATLREHQLQAGMIFPVRHVRVSQTTLLSFVRTWDQYWRGDDQLAERRTAWRGGWSISTAREYGHSISQEDGGTVGLTTELARQTPGSPADAGTVTADGRFYWSPLKQHQVLAVRLAAGASMGDAEARRIFALGGAQANVSTLDFGASAISLLRGFGSGTFAGTRVALVNLEYRWPIARPQRGYGTWPLFVHTVHAAAFADLGQAWTRAFRLSDAKSAVGGELSAKLIVAYGFPVRLAVGGAWGRDGSGMAPSRASMYVRVGRSF